jgi:hypothetical protein
VVWEDAEGRVAGDTVCGDGAKGREGEVMFGKGEFCEWMASSEVAYGLLRGFPLRLLFRFLHCECWVKLKCTLIPVYFV